ncbi:MAG: response regulator transcription factor [Caulobacterales bacterium]|nr:response regulator transcription factor [Caulobacterales bacterium]
MRLLLIEDNRRLADMVAQGLVREGFVVDHRDTLVSAGEALEAADYDLVLLDIGMPDGDGLAFLKDQRQRRLQSPVLMLTARSGLDDRVSGLDAGADDYLVKPFEIAELAARCRALLRRPGASLGTVLEVGDLELDTGARQARVRDRIIELPPREYALLEVLARRRDTVVSRAKLEQSLYSLDQDISSNALDAVASRLRRRLASAGASAHLRTVHGVGYAITGRGPEVENA